MAQKFKNQLIGKRIVLKRTKPSIQMAQIMFKTIEDNRPHLKPWFPWEKFTSKVEDSLKYLFDKEEKTKTGEKVEYGIYVNNEYIGNIGVFDIDDKRKSAEVGYWLSTKFTRKGYMTEAVRVVEKELFTNLKLNRIQIKCDERNKASTGLAKKCGYKLEGKLRESDYSEHFKDLRNTLVFSKLKSEFKVKEK